MLKTAARDWKCFITFLELKDKLINYKGTEPILIETTKHQNTQALEDTQAVLTSLGYERDEIKSALSKAVSALNDNASAEDILKKSLQILSI